jgi:hypothetical protein
MSLVATLFGLDAWQDGLITNLDAQDQSEALQINHCCFECHRALLPKTFTPHQLQLETMSNEPELRAYKGWGELAKKELGYSQTVRIGNVIKISGQGTVCNDAVLIESSHCP